MNTEKSMKKEAVFAMDLRTIEACFLCITEIRFYGLPIHFDHGIKALAERAGIHKRGMVNLVHPPRLMNMATDSQNRLTLFNEMTNSTTAGMAIR